MKNIDFLLVANNLAIDFMNTEIVDRGERIDLLKSKADIYAWAHQAGFNMQVEAASPNMTAIKAFRSALRLLITQAACEANTHSEAMATLNKWLPKGIIEQRLDVIEGQFTLSPLYRDLSIDMLLGRIAIEAAQLLSSPNLTKVKPCANPKCVIMFLDTSRSGRRRWCSMDTCGNRAKAANHYLNTKA